MKEYHKLLNKLFFRYTILFTLIAIPFCVIYFMHNTLSPFTAILMCTNTMVVVLFLSIFIAQYIFSHQYVKSYGGVSIIKACGPAFLFAWILIILLFLLQIYMFISNEIVNAAIYLPFLYTNSYLNPYIILDDEFIGIQPLPVELHKILYYNKKVEKKKVVYRLKMTDNRDVIIKLKHTNSQLFEGYLEEHQVVCCPELSNHR